MTTSNLGMATRAAYVRVGLRRPFLRPEMPREAEWEILAALPTIDEQGMVPEGFAAVALLRESVRQRKTDPQGAGRASRVPAGKELTRDSGFEPVPPIRGPFPS